MRGEGKRGEVKGDEREGGRGTSKPSTNASPPAVLDSASKRNFASPMPKVAIAKRT
jgi:hypothetical protein